jgi:hypothetical protein
LKFSPEAAEQSAAGILTILLNSHQRERRVEVGKEAGQVDIIAYVRVGEGWNIVLHVVRVAVTLP